jgi:hypothetical protein
MARVRLTDQTIQAARKPGELCLQALNDHLDAIVTEKRARELLHLCRSSKASVASATRSLEVSSERPGS